MTVYEVISMVLSVIAMALSSYVYFKNKLFQTANIQMSLRTAIDKCSSDVALELQEYSILKNNEDVRGTQIEILNSAIKSYLNKFEDGCSFYFRGKLDKADFMEAFRNEICEIFQNDTYKPFLSADNAYPNLKKFYNYRLRSLM